MMEAVPIYKHDNRSGNVLTLSINYDSFGNKYLKHVLLEDDGSCEQ